MQTHVHVSRPIVAALLLDSSDQSILSTARFLSKKLHAPLHLVHAVRPLFSYVGSGDIVVNPYYGYESNFSDNEEKEAKAKLDAIRESIDDVEVSAEVLRDFPAEAILSFAQERHAGLIVCGVRKEDKNRNRFLSGLSTGFALASDAEVPVLLVPLNKAIDFTRPLRMLIADNLESEGEAALKVAISLANALHAQQLTHVHVQDTTYGEIDKMIESVRESMLKGQIPADPILNRDFYIERVRAKTCEELQRRCHVAKSTALNSCVYEPVVAFGHPSDEVHSELVRNPTQIMIFGRHHLIRRKTFALGRIPYNAMIEEGVATLVVPDSKTEANLFMGSYETIKTRDDNLRSNPL
ncbi:MAG: universal stress protein [Oligoflexus sp.]|nr:universal stress protein [Oligoflexus sp.]